MRTVGGAATLDGMSAADSYVVALDAALVGPSRVRRGLVQEARDHLDDASAAYRRAGYERAESERRAITDFGDLDEIVPAFQTTLAVAAGRRTAWLLFAILVIQPFLWDGALSTHTAPPDGTVYAILDVGVEVVGGAMIVLALLLVIASTIGNRWWHAGRGFARLTAYVALGAAVSTKTIGAALTLLSSGLDILPWLLLLAFIVVPMSVAATSARRTLATC